MPPCVACNLPIDKKPCEPEPGLTYHPQCFNCRRCSTNLANAAYYPEWDENDEETGHFLCESCFEADDPICARCDRPIQDQICSSDVADLAGM